MNHIRVLGPLALLVSGLLYMVADTSPGGPGLPAGWGSIALMAPTFLLLLAFWRGDRISSAWHGTSAWLRSVASAGQLPAQRLTIRIRCHR